MSDFVNNSDMDYTTAKTTAFDYLDTNGNLLYTKVRYEDIANGSKSFKITNKNTDGTTLYNLQSLNEVQDEIWLAEGEKCVETLKPIAKEYHAVVLGFNNFTKEFIDFYEDYFRFKDIVIFEDADEKGYKNTKQIVEVLQNIVNSIKLVEFRNKGNGYDIADFLRDNAQQDFEILYENSKVLVSNLNFAEYNLGTDMLMSHIPEPTILLEGYYDVPAGVVSVFAGKGGEGKSLLSIYFSILLAQEGKKTAIVSLEDSFNTILLRYQKMLNKHFNGDYSIVNGMVKIIRLSDFNLFKDGELTKTGRHFIYMLRKLCADRDMVFIDPIGFLFTDENSNNSVELLMHKLQSIAETTNCTVVLVHHLNKINNDDYNSIRGASAIANNARHVAILHKEQGTLKVKVIKNNYYYLSEHNFYNLVDNG